MAIDILKSKLNDDEAFLIVSPENRMYLTGFESSDGFLFITNKKTVFLTDSRYIEAAGNKAENCDEILLLTNSSKQLSETVSNLKISKVYTEAEKLTVSQFMKLEKDLGCEVVADKTDEIVTSLRRVKSQKEKDTIVHAQRIAEKAFDEILRFIRPGVTEREIKIHLDFCMLKNGADGIAFDTIAISGKNTSMPHGVPTDKVVEIGDFVTMDYGALVNGYRSDMTRTVAVGSVSEKQAEVYETVLKAQKACAEIVGPGISCKEADYAARSIIEKAGYGDCFGHGTGHGVGIDVHELPNLSPRSNLVLQPGDIVTDEPGIYIPSEFGVRIEDMLYITEEGCENLTKCEKSLIVLS